MQHAACRRYASGVRAASQTFGVARRSRTRRRARVLRVALRITQLALTRMLTKVKKNCLKLRLGFLFENDKSI